MLFSQACVIHSARRGVSGIEEVQGALPRSVRILLEYNLICSKSSNRTAHFRFSIDFAEWADPKTDLEHLAFFTV